MLCKNPPGFSHRYLNETDYMLQFSIVKRNKVYDKGDDFNFHSSSTSIILWTIHLAVDTIFPGAGPGFEIRGGALKIIAPSGARGEHFWDISCGKSRFYVKKIIFFPILGGRAPGAPPLDPPLIPEILLIIRK